MKKTTNLTLCFPCSFWQRNVSDDEFFPSASSVQGFRNFSYKELKTATSNFKSSYKIGEGSFGSVYKGYLRDGSAVAVKVLSIELESLEGEREFISEVTALSDIKHENLITLTGCCISGADRYLIYDYMENNSLAQAFQGGYESRKKFRWNMRRDISLGIARGLAFLHEELEPHIVHRDIKPANILLDIDFRPKIADFGLSKLLRDNTSHVSTRVAGTLGYIAPEYAITGHLTRKSDVYSFGVLLLHLITGLPVVEFNLEQGDSYLVDKAWDEYRVNNLLRLMDPTLDNKFPEQEAAQVLKVGLLCVQETASLRPQMSAVAKMLADEISWDNNVTVSKPGHLPDYKQLKIAHNPLNTTATDSSNNTFFTATTMTL